jgi:hypothetical protein
VRFAPDIASLTRLRTDLANEEQAEAPSLHRHRRGQYESDLQQRARREECEDVGHVMLPAGAIDSGPGSGNSLLGAGTRMSAAVSGLFHASAPDVAALILATVPSA